MSKGCSICGHDTKMLPDGTLLHNYKWQPPGTKKYKDDLSKICKQPVYLPDGTLKGPCGCAAATRMTLQGAPIVEISADGKTITTKEIKIK